MCSRRRCCSLSLLLVFSGGFLVQVVSDEDSTGKGTAENVSTSSEGTLPTGSSSTTKNTPSTNTTDVATELKDTINIASSNDVINVITAYTNTTDLIPSTKLATDVENVTEANAQSSTGATDLTTESTISSSDSTNITTPFTLSSLDSANITSPSLSSSNSTTVSTESTISTSNSTTLSESTVPSSDSTTVSTGSTIYSNSTTVSTESTISSSNSTTVSTEPTSSSSNSTTISLEFTVSPSDGTNSTTVVESSTEAIKARAEISTNETNGTIPSNQSPHTISIFFVNDLQYDLFPVHLENGTLCDPSQAGGNCTGGLAQLKCYMRSRGEGIWLNAGNTVGGDLFRFLRFDNAAQALRLLEFNATTDGSTAFQYGADAALNYLNDSGAVLCNTDPAPKKKSVLLTTSSCNISVIGYVGNSQPEQETFGYSIHNYTESIIEELDNVKSSQEDASQLITVVLGSSSTEAAASVASIEGISLVLFSGADFTEGETQDQETYYWRKMANKTTYLGSLWVNHTGVDNRFLVGQIELLLGDNCSVINASLAAESYSDCNASDTDALNIIKSGFAKLESVNKTLTKNTRNVTGEATLCYHAECSVGNLITDGMVAALDGDGEWNENGSVLAVFPAAHLLSNATIPKGNVNLSSLYSLIDRDAYLYSVALTVQELRTVLETSLKNSSDFLHISGLLQVEYRYQTHPEKKLEIVSIRKYAASSNSMQLVKVDMDSTDMFNISMPLCLLEMQSYNTLFRGKRFFYHSLTVIDALEKYTKSTNFLHLPLLGTRIILLQPEKECTSSTGVTIIVTLVLAALFVGCCYGVWRFVFLRYRRRSDSNLPMLNFSLS